MRHTDLFHDPIPIWTANSIWDSRCFQFYFQNLIMLVHQPQENMASFSDAISKLDAYGNPCKHFKYGTAGFRDDHKLLTPVVFRVGMVAAARSIDLGGKFVGIMITASHNLENDNGLKIVDSDGGMLAATWEKHAERIVNILDSKEIFEELMKTFDSSSGKIGNVFIGRDTRPHSEGLMKIAVEGIQALGGKVFDLGVTTTPQVHYVVDRYNRSPSIPLDGLLSDYYSRLLGGYNRLVNTCTEVSTEKAEIIVDCAKGVGSVSTTAFSKLIAEKGSSTKLCIDSRNVAYSGSVNENCGAEHCQKLQQPPIAMSAPETLSDVNINTNAPLENKLLCSLDGDADRIVFHMFRKTNNNCDWILYDGDKIACLIALFMKTELEEAGMLGLESNFKMGTVQTAYANGASTHYLRSKGITVIFAKTGVKYLHKAAHDNFDCAVYFEANGHGTVLFSPSLVQRIKSFVPTGVESARKILAFERLHASLDVVNQVTGDAVSDMLFVMAILKVSR